MKSNVLLFAGALGVAVGMALFAALSVHEPTFDAVGVELGGSDVEAGVLAPSTVLAHVGTEMANEMRAARSALASTTSTQLPTVVEPGIDGRVVWKSDGSGVEGITLYWSGRPASDPPERDVEIGRVVTGAGGAFELPVARSKLVRHEELAVHVSESALDQRVVVPASEVRAGAPIQIVLDDAGLLRISVRQDDPAIGRLDLLIEALVGPGGPPVGRESKWTLATHYRNLITERLERFDGYRWLRVSLRFTPRLGGGSMTGRGVREVLATRELDLESSASVEFDVRGELTWIRSYLHYVDLECPVEVVGVEFTRDERREMVSVFDSVVSTITQARSFFSQEDELPRTPFDLVYTAERFAREHVPPEPVEFFVSCRTDTAVVIHTKWGQRVTLTRTHHEESVAIPSALGARCRVERRDGTAEQLKLRCVLAEQLHEVGSFGDDGWCTRLVLLDSEHVRLEDALEVVLWNTREAQDRAVHWTASWTDDGTIEVVVHDVDPRSK